jgi:hypothetical protein
MRPVRVAIFLMLLGVHGLAAFYFATLRDAVPDSRDDGFSATLFFVASYGPRSFAPMTKRRGRSPKPQVPLPPQPSVSTAQGATAPIAIDWVKEAERVAADRGASGRSAGEGTRSGTELAPVVAHQPFGWDFAHTHRIESLPDGGLLVNLSDRCSLVVKFPMLLGGCRIGKIESRGDLFARMQDQ